MREKPRYDDGDDTGVFSFHPYRRTLSPFAIIAMFQVSSQRERITLDIIKSLSEQFKTPPAYVKNIVSLIDDGNTIPFIARYRKEMTGAMDDQVLRELADRLTYLRNLEARKAEVKASIEEQGKWTDELNAALAKAETLAEVEDIYRPL